MSKTFVVRLRTGSTTGNIVANSQIITIDGLGANVISGNDFVGGSLSGTVSTSGQTGSFLLTIAGGTQYNEIVVFTPNVVALGSNVVGNISNARPYDSVTITSTVPGYIPLQFNLDANGTATTGSVTQNTSGVFEYQAYFANTGHTRTASLRVESSPGANANISFTANTVSVNEGGTVFYTINGTDIDWGPSGRVFKINWLGTGITAGDMGFGTLVAQATFQASNLPFVYPVPIAEDYTTEGSELLVARLSTWRADQTETGNAVIVGYANVTINDTSVTTIGVTPPPAITSFSYDKTDWQNPAVNSYLFPINDAIEGIKWWPTNTAYVLSWVVSGTITGVSIKASPGFAYNEAQSFTVMSSASGSGSYTHTPGRPVTYRLFATGPGGSVNTGPMGAPTINAPAITNSGYSYGAGYRDLATFIYEPVSGGTTTGGGPITVNLMDFHGPIMYEGNVQYPEYQDWYRYVQMSVSTLYSEESYNVEVRDPITGAPSTVVIPKSAAYDGNPNKYVGSTISVGGESNNTEDLIYFVAGNNASQDGARSANVIFRQGSIIGSGTVIGYRILTVLDDETSGTPIYGPNDPNTGGGGSE